MVKLSVHYPLIYLANLKLWMWSNIWMNFVEIFRKLSQKKSSFLHPWNNKTDLIFCLTSVPISFRWHRAWWWIAEKNFRTHKIDQIKSERNAIDKMHFPFLSCWFHESFFEIIFSRNPKISSQLFLAQHELWCSSCQKNSIRRHNINYMARFVHPLPNLFLQSFFAVKLFTNFLMWWVIFAYKERNIFRWFFFHLKVFQRGKTKKVYT